ncbi:MAG: alpha-L-fucosidase, partial [Acetatifactor sp.]|nr:alpha-L-fucosidase [Acetatifactor sp.]
EMAPEGFNPPNLDCRQWIRTANDAGTSYAVMTCKQHVGLANWPSAYTSYNISKAPWKDGKGDVVADYVAACREFGLKVGLYFSPADANIIGRNLTAAAYAQNFIDQISELLTNYGKIDYLWFDGCGSEGHGYDRERIIRVIRTLQPEILIFNMWDPDTRWIGNEEGIAPIRSYNEVEDLDFSVRTDRKDALDSRRFLPAECGMRMRRDTWFGSEQDADTVKTLDQLMGIYDYTVGRGINLLLNIGPDASGQLPEADTKRVLEFGQALRERFASPLLVLENPVLDEEKEELIIDLPEETTLNCIVLSEHLEEGEAVRSFQIYSQPVTAGRRLLFYEGYQVGHK